MQRLIEVIDELEKVFLNFEVRDSQRQMMETMYTSMLQGEKCAIHAPTGIGKSLGYLIPYVAVKLDRPQFKMTVSTFTIHLQEQLKKEIALIQKLYTHLSQQGQERPLLNVVTWKGKSNYYCEARAIQAAPFISESKEQQVFSRLEQRMRELKEKRTNQDRQHVGFAVTDNIWQKVSVEHCDKKECSLRHDCTYYRHYFGDQWDLLILNHSLYFTYHFYVKPWDVDFSVFDEAHHLSKVLINSATYSLSYDQMSRWVQQGGFLARKYGFDAEEAEAWEERFLNDEAVLRFKLGERRIRDRMSEDTLIFKSSGFMEAVADLIEWQKKMYHSLTNERLPETVDDTETTGHTEEFAKEKQSWVMQLLNLQEFHRLLTHPSGLLWTEKEADHSLTYKVTPRNMDFFDETLFGEGAGFTSGTLAQDGSCQAFEESLRLDVQTDEVLPTPFPLADRTRVYVSPNVNPKAALYREQLAAEILRLLQAGELKTFVLFSSIRLMHDQYGRLKDEIASLASGDLPVRVWVQDKYNKDKIIQSFENEEEKSVLFGSLTFFEGVDLKGSSLTQVILTKLPFAYYRHPIQQILNQNGKYLEWEAVLRFEQAYGRLMRRMDDYGTFAILDRRFSRHPAFSRMLQKAGVPIVSSVAEIAAFYEQMQAKQTGYEY